MRKERAREFIDLLRKEVIDQEVELTIETADENDKGGGMSSSNCDEG